MTEIDGGNVSDVEAELARLRAENERLHSELDHRSSGGGARRWASIVLAVLVAVLVPLSLITIWAERTVLNTDDYVETVAPLAEKEAIQQRVAELITANVNESVDFGAIAEDLLPDDLQVLSGPIAGGAEQIVARVVTEVVQSDLFPAVWEEANRIGHAAVLAALTGEGSDLVTSEDGRIAITLAPVLQQVGESLGGLISDDFVDGLGLDELDVEYVLVDSDELARTQDAIDLLDQLGWWLPFITVVLGALVVVIAKDRRLGVRRLALACGLSTLVTIGLVAVVRDRALDNAVDPEAASVAFDTLVRFLRRALRAVLVLSVILLAAVWIVGPSPRAGRVRAWLSGLADRVGERSDPDAVGAVPVWVAAHRTGLQFAAVALAGLALVLWDRPTGLVVLLLAIALLLVLAAIAVLGRVGDRAAVAPGSVTGASVEDAAAGAQAAQSAQNP